jgi:heme-degrading monooxygenase HmoA
MLVKWITCWPTDRAAFGLGQEAWGELHGVPGFLGQGGGWSRNTAGMVQIFGFWSDPSSYQAFMDGAHDRIAAAQVGTFEDLRVRVFGQRLNIGHGFPASLSAVSLLRLAHCQARRHRQAHFVRTQASVWNPGMAASSGMCGGVFAQSGDLEFLVLSAWRTSEDHQRYLDERFDRLRERAGLTADLDSVTGDLVDLEPSWTVRG